jgi:hypothetical protein
LVLLRWRCCHLWSVLDCGRLAQGSILAGLRNNLCNGVKMMKQQNNVFIDPENCGSSVGYYITIEEYSPKNEPKEYSISANVILADCNHKIAWNFSDNGLDKIDAAIAMLQEFRKKYFETEKLVKRLKK